MHTKPEPTEINDDAQSKHKAKVYKTDYVSLPERYKKRYPANPFVTDMAVRIDKNAGRKPVSMAILENEIVNRQTGEKTNDIMQYKNVYKNVDSSAFVKVYLEGIDMIADLNQAAIGVLAAIWRLYRTETPMYETRVYVSYNDMKMHKHYSKSRRTFIKGMNTLLRNEFIAYSKYENQYFVNPLYFFNGDTIEFMKRWRLSEDSPLHSSNKQEES